MSGSPVNAWTPARQAPLSMGFPRQRYWNGLPFPSLGDLPDPGIKPTSPAWQMDSLALSHQGRCREQLGLAHLDPGEQLLPPKQVWLEFGYTGTQVWHLDMSLFFFLDMSLKIYKIYKPWNFRYIVSILLKGKFLFIFKCTVFLILSRKFAKY